MWDSYRVSWDSYRELLRMPRTWAVFYVRTNLVKRFVSTTHKRLSLNVMCGTSKSISIKQRDCLAHNGIAKEHFFVNAAELVEETHTAAKWYAKTLTSLKGLGAPLAVVTYEALLLDPVAELERLACILGLKTRFLTRRTRPRSRSPATIYETPSRTSTSSAQPSETTIPR